MARQTRSTNMDQHPGVPDKPATRRTPAQMAAAKGEAQKKAEILAAKKKASNARTAQLEDEMAMEDVQTRANAARPPPKASKVVPKKTSQVTVAYDDIYGEC